MGSPFLDLSQLGLPIDTKKKEEVRFNCPYCEDERFHLYVNTKKKVYHCFRCGAAGRTNVSSFGLAEIHFKDSQKFKSSPAPLRLPKPYSGLLTTTAIRYLAKRGLKESDIARHKLYCAAPHSIYFGRVIIPYNARQGYCDYFVARSYTKIGFPRYLNPPGGHNVLFKSPDEPDSYFPQYWRESTILLVEGPFDYLKASRHGPAAALLGKELKDEQARTIVTEYSQVMIMLDRGMQESMAAIKIADKLRSHVDVRILECPKKDPGEMDERDFKHLLL